METKSSVELPGRRTGLTFTRGEVLETRARGGGTAVCLYVVLLNGAPEMVKMVDFTFCVLCSLFKSSNQFLLYVSSMLGSRGRGEKSLER